MDAIVEAALRKWPNVPHCHGWLALDARGDWYMRDERVQAAGPFPRVKGSRIQHEKLLAFIHRNYAADADGAWYFQNGPQRVYVQLEAAPWVWRVADAAAGSRLQAHTGHAGGQGGHFEDRCATLGMQVFDHVRDQFGAVKDQLTQAAEVGGIWIQLWSHILLCGEYTQFPEQINSDFCRGPVWRARPPDTN